MIKKCEYEKLLIENISLYELKKISHIILKNKTRCDKLKNKFVLSRKKNKFVLRLDNKFEKVKMREFERKKKDKSEVIW